MYPAVNETYRSPINPATDGFIDIKVKTESNATLTALYNDSLSAGSLAGPNTLIANFVNAQPFYWGSPGTYSWNTGAMNNSEYIYPEGTYVVWAESTLHNMKKNYVNGEGSVYTGKTVSPLYTITVSSGLPQARFQITKDITISTGDNQLADGIYDGRLQYGLTLNHLVDGSGTLFGNLSFAITAQDIAGVDWQQYAQWDESSAQWDFPEQFALEERADNYGLGPHAETSITVPQPLNLSMTRSFNRTVFNETGYQLIQSNITFTNTDFQWVWWAINAPSDDLVTATFVPGTFVTNAPVDVLYEDTGRIFFMFNRSAITVGVPYTFSVVERVEPTGFAVEVIPPISVGQGIYHDQTTSGPAYSINMPEGLLPQNVTAASVTKNVSSTWELVEDHHVISTLESSVKPAGSPLFANYTTNITSGIAPLTVEFTDISTGSPMPTMVNLSFGDGEWTNSTGSWTHTYTDEGTYFPVIYASNGISNATGTNATISVNVTPDLDPELAEAYNIVLNNETILDGTSTGKLVSAMPDPVDEGTSVEIWGDKPALLAPASGWLFFIDDYPGANWEHPCRYVFVDENDQITVVEAMSPPTNFELRQIAGEITDPWGDANSVTSVSQNPGGGLGTLNLEPACSGADCRHQYALLISGGFDTSQNHMRYWNDISFMYQTLNQTYGYPADHIIVLVSDGTSPAADRHNATAANGVVMTDNSPVDLDTMYGPVDVKGDAKKTTVTSTLTSLNNQLTAEDSLFIFTTSHGGWDGVQNSNNSVLYLWNQEYITDTEFVNALPTTPGNITIVMEQCYSGGFIDNFIDQYSGTQKRVIATAATGNEPSWGNGFSNAWTSGVARIDEARLPNFRADTNGDTRISMAEAYNYARSYDPAALVSLPIHEHPQYSAKNPVTVGTNQYLSTCPVSTLATIKVTSPNTAESWKKGSTYYITWTETGLTQADVNISLWKGTVLQHYIAQVPAVSSRYFWQVPTTLATGTDYWINISSVATDPVVSDRSDVNFGIEPAGAPGYLWVNTTPVQSATIYVDGIVKGTTNSKLTLNNGEHNVTVAMAAYYAMQSTAEVRSGQTTVTAFILEPVQPADVYPYGSIVIDSEPQGAEISIDGDNTGLTTPAHTEIMNGDHEVVVTSYGYVTPSAQFVHVPEHETVNLDFTLSTPAANVIPLVDAGTNAAVTAGSLFTSSGFFLDSGADTWTATVNYGDGSGITSLALNADKTFDLTHTYSSAGTYTVTVTVMDNRGGNGNHTTSVTVTEPPSVLALPGYTNSPTDPDGDGIYEDINGNGRLDFADVVLYFNEMEWIADNEPVTPFDLNTNGRIDFADIVQLFGEI